MERPKIPRRINVDAQEGKRLDFGELTYYNEARAIYAKTLQDGRTRETVF